MAGDAHRLAAERAQVRREPRSTTCKPRAITRDLDWGVPDAARRLARPADEAALRLVRRGDRLPVGVGRVGAARAGDPDAWKQWWTDPDARGYYFMGKDNIVFHSVIWPAMLLGHNGAGRQGRHARRVRHAEPARPRSSRRSS